MANFDSRMNCNTSCSAESFSRGLASCVGGFLLACLTVGFLTPASDASDTDFTGSELMGEMASGMTPGSDFWGDDTIGALPIMGGGGSFSGAGSSGLDLLMLYSRPCIVLEGAVVDLRRMVTNANGDLGSFVYLEPTAQGQARLFFQGASAVELDRHLFATGLVTVSMYIGGFYTRNDVELELGSKTMAAFNMTGGTMMPMNLQLLVGQGVLDSENLDVTVQSGPRLGLGLLGISTDPNYITLRQQQ